MIASAEPFLRPIAKRWIPPEMTHAPALDPAEPRVKLIHAFKMLENKVVNNPRKKHGNIPL